MDKRTAICEYVCERHRGQCRRNGNVCKVDTALERVVSQRRHVFRECYAFQSYTAFKCVCFNRKRICSFREGKGLDTTVLECARLNRLHGCRDVHRGDACSVCEYARTD